MSSAKSRNLWLIIPVAIFGAYLARQTIRSIKEVIEVNDFEVFHHIGEVAATHQSIIYDVASPVKQRGPFLYPPSAAVLFVPLSWLSHDAAGIVFSIVKIGCLVLLYLGSVRWSQGPPRSALLALLAMLVPLVATHRAIDSDVGNGQVNIVVAAAAVGSVWLMMLSRRGWWLGCVLLAAAIAIKLTPALLLAVPLLNRRWKAFGASLAMTAVLLVALPAFWFGPGNFTELVRRHAEITSRFSMDWPALNRQITLNELAQFSKIQLCGDQVLDSASGDSDRSPVITGKSGANLLNRHFGRRHSASGWPWALPSASVIC